MIVVNLNKAKSIAHERRRAKRELEFAPFDALIAKQIPGSYEQQAEVERQKIRNKYDEIQIAIDKAETPDQIKAALEQA
jgi:hypothetical protein